MISDALDSRAFSEIVTLGVFWLLIATLGCAGVPPRGAGPWTPGDGFIEVDTQGRGLLLIRPDHQLARFLQRRELGGGTATGTADASLRRLGAVVGVAMRDMGRQLQHLTPPTRGGWDAHCKGGMTSVALGSH